MRGRARDFADYAGDGDGTWETLALIVAALIIAGLYTKWQDHRYQKNKEQDNESV